METGSGRFDAETIERTQDLRRSFPDTDRNGLE